MRRTSVLVAALLLAPLTTLAQNDMTMVRVTMTVDGNELATFSEFGGVVAEVQSLEFFEGTESRGRVTLSRPVSSNLDLWAWHEAGLRKPVTLFFYNRRGDLILRYQLDRAWPARVEISRQKTGSSDVLMETVTIIAASIRRVTI